MIEIEQYIYDMTEAGEAIILYRMSFDNGTVAEVCNLGATTLSVKSATGDATKQGLDIIALDSATKQLSSHIWDSRVEVNRVVMTTSAENDTLQVEAVFDLDSECNFEVTYRAVSCKPTTLWVASEPCYNLLKSDEITLRSVEIGEQELLTLHILYNLKE